MSADDQGELFTQNEHVLTPKKLARTHDPETSKMAARSVRVFAGSHYAKILTALVQQGPGTFYDIAKNAHLEPSSVWRRLNELERMGLIETTGEERQGPTGRLCRVWIACQLMPEKL